MELDIDWKLASTSTSVDFGFDVYIDFDFNFDVYIDFDFNFDIENRRYLSVSFSISISVPIPISFLLVATTTWSASFLATTTVVVLVLVLLLQSPLFTVLVRRSDDNISLKMEARHATYRWALQAGQHMLTTK